MNTGIDTAYGHQLIYNDSKKVIAKNIIPDKVAMRMLKL